MPVPLIIDCDPGIDDALALMLAAASPELDLLGVTCVAGNRPVDVTSANACRVLDLAGRPDVPVHAGCARPLAHPQPQPNLVHREDGLGGVSLQQRRGPSPLHAVDFLEQQLGSAPGRITVVALGPLSNLALAEARRPGVLRRAHQVLVMGGAAFVPGNITPCAEFNFHADALAASMVLRACERPRLYGLDVTRRLAPPAAWTASLGELPNRCGPAARAMLHGHARPEPALHDVCPVACLLAPQHFVHEPCLVAVDARPGLTEGYLWARRLPGDGPPEAAPAAVCTGIEPGAVLSLLHERLATLP